MMVSLAEWRIQEKQPLGENLLLALRFKFLEKYAHGFVSEVDDKGWKFIFLELAA